MGAHWGTDFDSRSRSRCAHRVVSASTGSLIERDVAFGAHELVEHGAHLGRHGDGGSSAASRELRLNSKKAKSSVHNTYSYNKLARNGVRALTRYSRAILVLFSFDGSSSFESVYGWKRFTASTVLGAARDVPQPFDVGRRSLARASDGRSRARHDTIGRRPA